MPLPGLVVVLDVSADCPDVDAWYLRQRRLVLGGMLGANVASWVGQIVLALTLAAPELHATKSDSVLKAISTATGLATVSVLIALLLVRYPRLEVALLLVSGSTETPG